MQVAAIAFVVILIVAMAVGCAKYDGDQAAFCDQLGDVPSFMQLAARVNSGTDEQAAATMQAAAEQFRSLERVAPRSIRVEVAALGDAAERIESHIGPGGDSSQYADTGNEPGAAPQVPLTFESQFRLGAFYDEMQNHHGTVTAVYSLMSYATKDCGISDASLDLGMFGYGPSENFGSDFGGTGTFVDPGGTGSVGVPAVPEPDPCRGPGCAGDGAGQGLPGSGHDGGGVQLAPPATSSP